MRRIARHNLFISVMCVLLAAASVSAEEPTIHGYLKYQLGTTVTDAQIVRNAVTAEVELGYRGADIDVFLNPAFEIAPVTSPDIGIREAYLDYYTEYIDFRFGKQIIIWGKSDGLAVTDIVSPKDLTNFLIPEFRELRLGVVAAQARAYLGPAVMELVYIPRFTPSVLPAPGSIWYRPPGASAEAPVEPTINPTPPVGSGLDDGELYGRFRMYTSLLDFDVVGGYYWTNEPLPTIIKELSSPGVISSITVTPEHYRQWLAGGAISSSVGPFILRAESGFFTPRRFLTTDMSDSDGYVEKDYVQSLAGLDTVLAGIDLSAQLMHRYIVNYEDPIRQDEHSWTVTLRARRSFFRNRLVIDAFSYIGLNEPDGLVKAGMSWAPTDGLSFRTEANFFFGENGQFGVYDDNDLVVISVGYSY